MSNSDLTESLLAQLKQLVEINSYTNNPEGIAAVADSFRNLLADLPLTWKEYEPQGKNPEKFGKLVFARTQINRPDRPNIVLSGHLDTVFPPTNDFQWQRTIQYPDRVIGPGVNDMKGGLVVIAEVLNRLAKTSELENLTLIIMPDEEQLNLQRFPQLKELLTGQDYALLYEAETNSAIEDNSIRKIVSQRKGFLGCRLTAKAAGGHSGIISEQAERHSAIHELIFQASNILQLADFSKGTTTNVGKIQGGNAINALAQAAQIEFDARVQTKVEYERISQAYQYLIENKQDSQVELNLEILNAVYPLEETSATKTLFEKARTGLAKLGITAEAEFRGGGSDANRFHYFNPNLGIIDGLGPQGDNDHTPQEYLKVASLEQAVNQSLAIISELIKN